MYFSDASSAVLPINFMLLVNVFFFNVMTKDIQGK
jgi:hypothetical protein